MTDLRPIDRSLPRPTNLQAGPAPMLQWIDIEQLVVDDRYQRGLQRENFRNIRRIAEGFDWSKFSTVHVAPIEGGLFAIIDGQHRCHAAAACGFSQVPCQVTHMSLQQQASAFAAINGLVTKVTPWQIFKAAIAAGEEWAVEVDEVASDAGCRAMPYNKGTADRLAGEIYSINFLRDVVARRGARPVSEALTILRKAEGLGDVPEAFAFGLLKPIVEALVSRPHVLARADEARHFLENHDIWESVAEADRFVMERRRQGLPSVTKNELLESLLGDAIDKAMPQRMALPAMGDAA